jgi:hypothetical protein
MRLAMSHDTSRALAANLAAINVSSHGGKSRQSNNAENGHDHFHLRLLLLVVLTNTLYS